MKWFDWGKHWWCGFLWLVLLLLKVICKKNVELFGIFVVDPSLLLKSLKVHLGSHLKSLLPHCHKWFCTSAHCRIA